MFSMKTPPLHDVRSQYARQLAADVEGERELVRRS